MNLVKRFPNMTRAVPAASSRAGFLRRFAWRPLPLVLAAATFFAVRRGREVDGAAPSPQAALADVLTRRGLACAGEDVTWTTGPAGVKGAMLGGARAIVRATPKGEPPDLFLVEVRLSPEGAVLEVGASYNLTRTTAAEESRPTFDGRFVAFTTASEGLVTGVHTIDLAGQGDAATADFTRTQRMQVALTNLQQTGQTAGVGHNAFGLDPVATKVTLRWESPGRLAVQSDDHAIVIDAAKGAAVTGESFVRAAPMERAKPGNLVTWGVDRVRDMPWFGEERMQWVKAIAFTALDWVNAKFAKETTAEDVKNEMGLGGAGGAGAGPAPVVAYTDPEIGWPPAPLKPQITPPLPGEGEWLSTDKDAFITQVPGAPAAFVTSFVRPNPRRADLRVYVTLWDPRQIQLHMVSGTVEPVSATGERGTGMIPRTPEVLRRTVAAFNGGFQAQHGEFGMMASGVLYLPPKPYAATVMELRDGSTAFGTWPPGAMEIPAEMLSFRQNLTALVDFDRFNPWGRNWWGGTPPGWADNIHSTRSALCLTKDGFVGYFWSASISPDDLAAALLAARCQYGMHLDMNPGHAGFEFYNIMPASEWKALGRPMQTDWENEGKVSQMPDWMFRGRRMIKGMGHMNFPRYIQRDGRDFFYLTTRAVLPGPDAPTAAATKEDQEGVWRVKGLPQHGFPYALATTFTRPDGKTRVRVLRVDPRTVKPAGSASVPTDAPTVLSFVADGHAPPTHGAEAAALFYAGGNFSIGKAPSGSEALALATGTGAGTPGVRAAAGVHDEDGMLTWVELAPDAQPDATTAKVLTELLAKLGCSSTLLIAPGQRPLLGGSLDLGAAPATGVTATNVRLVRGKAPAAHALFEDTALVPLSVWQPAQSARVKLPTRTAPGTPSGRPAPPPPAPAVSSAQPAP